VPTYVRQPLPRTGIRVVDDLFTEEGSPTTPPRPPDWPLGGDQGYIYRDRPTPPPTVNDGDRGPYEKYVRPALRGIHSAIEAARPQSEIEHMASLVPLGAGRALTAGYGGLLGDIPVEPTLRQFGKKLGLRTLRDYAAGVGKTVYDAQLGAEPPPAAPDTPGMFKPQHTFPRAMR
jgi:hypothetical protein